MAVKASARLRSPAVVVEIEKKEWSGSEEEPRYIKPQTVEFAAKMAEKMIASVAQKERRRRRRCRPQVSKIAP